ncbi:TetR/AcrR family transcriptional regulator [Catenuloplanes japonicus]|uniref:TetR/AcrR family transcriptional regulator n=1 Tax=Catenuloplanes japonicus TaxID=33876 RepID=UPI000A5CBE70|nr:TetR/AcrR family transcriptional regulator [Catenuloplanes japonicus]
MTRAEMQEHNRRKVIAAARIEFLARGFRDAKIDDIAERAELTRGAVYSNFTSKRALYLTVLLEALADAPGAEVPPARPRTVADALAVFARAWTARLQMVTDAPRLDAELLPEIMVAKSLQLPFAQLTGLSALILGLVLERMENGRDRMVRTAEAALTTLHGASQLAAAAPHFVDPFAITAAVAHLARLDLGDGPAPLDGGEPPTGNRPTSFGGEQPSLGAGWPPPHLPFTAPAAAVDAPWTPPAGAVDALRDRPTPLTEDGIVAVLGLHRLTAVEEALRGADEPVTLVLVTADPGELGPLARLVVADIAACLRATVPPTALPRLRIVHDETGTIATAAGIPSPGDGTEAAIRVANGRITARATGFGACHAVAAYH